VHKTSQLRRHGRWIRPYRQKHEALKARASLAPIPTNGRYLPTVGR
jgi:hypothetical protein